MKNSNRIFVTDVNVAFMYYVDQNKQNYRIGMFSNSSFTKFFHQGGYDTGKIGNFDIHFSRRKRREFAKNY